MIKVPHVIPYQGSKRKLASTIAASFPARVNRLYEPFAGSAAVTLYAAANGLAEYYTIGEALEPLVELHKTIIERPNKIADAYEDIWNAQPLGECAIEYFYKIRTQYNESREPEFLLFLILRCVANAIRFSGKGNFSQSPDKRRRGTNPKRLRASIFAVSKLLKGKTDFVCGDFTETIKGATTEDLVYMDPPYQGTSDGQDKRYFQQLDRERLIDCLKNLNTRKIPYIVSYDGQHGEKTYGDDLPSVLRAEKFLIHAGRSTQGTLSGRDVTTFESLYLSPFLKSAKTKAQLNLALI